MSNMVSSYGIPNGAPQRGFGGTLTAASSLPVSRQFDSYAVSGSGSISRLTSLPRGMSFILSIEGAPTFVNSTWLKCPGGADLRASSGDMVIARSEGNGAWRIYMLSVNKLAALKNIAPTDLNLSGTPSGASPRSASYTDLSLPVIGREYLGAWFKIWRTGTGSTAKILMRGDSTMVGTNLSSSASTPDQVLKEIALLKGVKITPTNLGVAGTTTADWLNTHLPSDLSTYTSGNIPKLYILNYGMNDPSVGPISPATTVSNLRAGFALLRGTWSADNTSVVYVMPSTAYDDTNGRNEAWREGIVNDIKQACRDYGVTFIDAYALFREARYGLVTGWIDATDKVHPYDDFTNAIWGTVADAVLPANVIRWACRPTVITPASGFTHPGSAENMSTRISGAIAIGSGYINMTSPAAIPAGTTLATVTANHAPATQAWGVQMAALASGTWQFFHGVITGAGVITNSEAISISAQRIYFGPGVWQI